MLGDSVGAQWSPLVEGILQQDDWQILVLTKSACAIVDRTWYYEPAGGNYDVCTKWRNAALGFVREVEPDLLFIGSSAFYRFERDDWIGGTHGIVEPAATAAGHVILVPGIPRLSFDGPSCLEDPWRFSFRLIEGDRECAEARTEKLPSDVAAHLRQVARRFDNVRVLELDDLVCPDGQCAAATPDGTAVFRDKTHVTASFARSLAPEARRRLAAAGVPISPGTPEPGTPTP